MILKVFSGMASSSWAQSLDRLPVAGYSKPQMAPLSRRPTSKRRNAVDAGAELDTDLQHVELVHELHVHQVVGRRRRTDPQPPLSAADHHADFGRCRIEPKIPELRRGSDAVDDRQAAECFGEICE